MKVTKEQVEQAEEMWREASGLVAAGLEDLMRNKTVAGQDEYDLRCDLERRAQVGWRITNQALTNDRVEKMMEQNERIAVALEGILSVMLERTKP